ncbi:MAG: hypothetical protein LBM00_11695, partial [Deltaproteobacteria bacterium]|nr:hypothetical protein [Deltaproteobacteria bacterium]
MAHRITTIEINTKILDSSDELTHKITTVENHTKALNSSLERLTRKLDDLIHSQIMLAVPVQSRFPLKLPGGDIPFYSTGNGAFCFRPAAPDNLHDRPVFISSLPKSGTWLVNKILDNLAFEGTYLHAAWDNVIEDLRTEGDLWSEIRQGKNFPVIPFPYHVLVNFIQNGQYLNGHLSGSLFEAVHKNGAALLSIRDLRTAFVSLARYNPQRFQLRPESSLTPADLLNQIQDQAGTSMFTLADQYAALLDKPFIGLVRFEELTTNGGGNVPPSVEAIARITGCDIEAVSAALHKSLGVRTPTWSGKMSSLKGLWTSEIEDAFTAKGGGLINEKLGYP